MAPSSKEKSLKLNANTARDNPFWLFSLSVYKYKQIEKISLTLQDTYHLDVNLLLFCAWLGIQQRSINMNTLDQNANLLYWQQSIVSPLRNTRRNMSNHNKTHTLYQELKRVELMAEQEIQFILWSTTSQFDNCSSLQDKEELIKQNIDTLWKHSSKKENATTINSIPPPLIHFCEWMITYSKGKI